MPDALRVAILGAGTVGREVVRAFLETPERLAVDGGPQLVLAGVAVRDIKRGVADGIPADMLTDAPAHLVASPETDVVVELMGGDEPARTLVAAALGAGKAVVTANKHVIAHHGPQLEAASRRSGAPLRFEAAVGGGIPVLGPLGADLAANCVERIRGIVNGTSNYVLTAMARDGRAYADVLADAQAAGYAEADPTADVEGIDAANKLAILARLGFGTWPDADSIERRPPSVRAMGRPGITGVSDREIAAAAALGLAIKLVAQVTPGGPLVDGRRAIDASVLPTALPLADPLARTDGVTNRIEVDAESLGSVAFAGPGAGGPATASAVLGDLLAIARGAGSTWSGRAPAVQAIRPAAPDPDRSNRPWFFVLPAGAATLPDVLRRAGAVSARSGDATAVRLPAMSLADLRRVLASALASAPAADRDLTLYPLDDRFGAAA